VTGAVLNVRTEAGRPAVLKLGAAPHEHLVLQRWHGAGAVLMLRADPARGALLLERLQAQDLCEHWDLDACEIVAGLYPRLHVPALPQLPRLSDVAEGWARRLAVLPRSAPVPHRLVEQAAALARDFAADDGTSRTTIHGDLHYGHVLAGYREDWLAIAPRPLAGDPHYEPGPLVWGRWDDVTSSWNVRTAIRQRLGTVVEAAGLDEDRARDWVVLRQVAEAVRALDDADAGRGGDPGPVVTRCVTVAKAVQG
jgi:streptomycin 6-kinase